MQAVAEHVSPSQAMIITTTENISGTRVVRTVGQVFGLTVRSRSLGGNIAAGLKSLAGGEIRETMSEIVAYGTAQLVEWPSTPPER